LKNEYPQFGGNFEVVHHTELIEDLIKKQKIKPVSAFKELRITYQDPCYLGRYNDIYDSPRNLITTIPGLSLSEMENNRDLSFCCGGGGGRMWLEEKTGQRINEMRLQHAIASKSQIVATACPFCLQMFEDAVRSREESKSMQVLDIAELLYDHLKIQQGNTGFKDSDK
jgi:Fe-S oxidoreductase